MSTFIITIDVKDELSQKKKVVNNNNKVRCILLPLLSHIIGGARMVPYL